MTFLPIVERELRQAARRRLTYWLRVIAGIVGLIVGGGYLLLLVMIPFPGARALGDPLFNILTTLSFLAVLSVGLFFTSDCLSEEKREGTLGFLFLTDLRGFDVVLGKLCATSLRSAFAMLAVFPVLAITLLLGGVEAGQFWKTMLALLNTMFFSLATGMFVSAISRHGQRALAGTFLLLAAWTLGAPLLDWIMKEWQGRPGPPRLALASPLTAFQHADRWSPTYWQALLVTQLLAWGQLALAAGRVRRNWQDKEREPVPTQRSWWRHGGERRRRKLRERWLERDPMLWLALRERGVAPAVLFWPALAIGAAVLIAFETTGGEIWVLWKFLIVAVTVVLYLAVAAQASSFFAEAKRSRMIELLLAAPLRAEEIVAGPWRALVRLFAGLVILLVLMDLLGAVFSVGMRQTVFGGLGVDENVLMLGITTLIGAVVTVANLCTVAWFGLWMGMTSRNAMLATLKTIVFVQLIPLFVISIAAGILVPLIFLPALFRGGNASASPNSIVFWYPLLTALMSGGLTLVKDLVFWHWTQRKLKEEFREQATRLVAPVVLVQREAPGERAGT